jgi:hypothetical protein
LESGFRALFLPALNSAAGNAMANHLSINRLRAGQTMKQASYLFINWRNNKRKADYDNKSMA